MKTPCECPVAGYCERHRMKKVGRLHELCQTDQRYFDKWESDATGIPISRKVRAKWRTSNPVEGPGTELHQLLKERGYLVKQGCSCQDRITKMNRWGVTECRRQVDEICGWLEQSAKKAGWFSKLAVTAPGVRNVARSKIKELVIQAIDNAHEKSKPVEFPVKPLPDNTALITVHWNAVGFRRLRDTYFEWLPTVGYPVQCLELVPPKRAPEIPGSTVVQGNARNVLWQKERLINMAISQLPADVEFVAWVDHDICFQREDWLTESIKLLDRYDAVQPWSVVQYTDLAGLHLRKMTSSGSVMPGPFANSNPGAAWVARRELLDRAGLYDQCVIGAGDAAWFTALTGLRRKFLEQMTPAHRRHWQRYADKVGGVRVGYLEGTVRHLWHGDMNNRQYQTRLNYLREHNFDPDEHLTTDNNGLLAWTDKTPAQLRYKVNQFFHHRREDG